MNKQDSFIILLAITIVGLSWIIANMEAACICDVRFVGQYSGTVLNQRNPENNCTTDIYFCGKSNLKQDAILLKTCNEKGNSCSQNVKCQCPSNLVRKYKYCGSDLKGIECKSNIIYRCPMIRRYSASPEDACLAECKDGKCLPMNSLEIENP